MTSILAMFAFAPAAVQGHTSFSNGLQTTVFDLPEGRVTVLLPADLAARDTISGTVIALPKGTGEELAKNGAVLDGLVVQIDDAPPKKGKTQPTWVIPAAAGTAVTLSLIGPNGTPKAECSIPTLPDQPQPFTGGDYYVDPIVHAGQPTHANGPFDGDLGNTTAMCRNDALIPVAESPRSCVFAGTPTDLGPANIEISDAGKTGTCPTNIVSVSLSAPKTTLLEGEKTTVTMTVRGLKGIPESFYPIPIEFINESPSVVRFDGFTDNHVAMGAPYSAVDNGVCTMTIGVVGTRPGSFQIRGLFFNVKMHEAKKLMNAEQFNAWVKGLVAAYEAKIKQLEEELKQNPKDKGLELNIQRKRRILGTLKGFTNTSNAELAAAKAIVDKSLADDALFKMAADLITTAASLLGYTDIPMPGVGAIVKGLRAIASAKKLAKVLEALDKVDRLIEQYEALKDLKEKADKAKEIKQALDKVKEALDKAE